MGDLIDLYNLLSENFPNSMEIVLNVIIILTAIIIAYKSLTIRHPRYLSRFIVMIILVLLIFNAVFFGLIGIEDKMVLSVVTVLLLSYIAVAYVAAKRPVGISKIKLEKLEDVIERGLSWDREDLFYKKSFYLIDFVEKYQYKLLSASHSMTLENFKGAYEIYNTIEEKRLFSNEKLELLRKKAYVLYILGDMTKAQKILESIEDEKEPNYLMLKAMIFENALDLDNASISLQKALNYITKGNGGILEAMIYNNYGRLRRMEGNLLDAAYYYRLSANIAKRYKNKQMIHVSFQNLIHILLLQEENEKSKEYLREYEKLIDKALLGDAKEYYNLKIEIARQNSNINELEKVLMDGYNDIRNKLQNKKQMLFDASVLRMLFSARMNFSIIMDQISSNLEEYFTLEIPDRYFCFKEIEIPLREINFPYCHKYAMIYKRVTDYMKTEALTDIEYYISSLKDYEIGARCQLEKERVGITKEHIKPYNFQAIYNRMVDIKDIYKKNDMLIDMIITDLDIADECFAPENLENEEIKALPLEKMKAHVKCAEESLSKLKKYPIVDECNIRLAMYFFKLKDENKTKKYLKEFESGNTSIENYALWIKRDYRFLKSRARS